MMIITVEVITIVLVLIKVTIDNLQVFQPIAKYLLGMC